QRFQRHRLAPAQARLRVGEEMLEQRRAVGTPRQRQIVQQTGQRIALTAQGRIHLLLQRCGEIGEALARIDARAHRHRVGQITDQMPMPRRVASERRRADHEIGLSAQTPQPQLVGAEQHDVRGDAECGGGRAHLRAQVRIERTLDPLAAPLPQRRTGEIGRQIEAGRCVAQQRLPVAPCIVAALAAEVVG
ncbi:hypothetical protein CATMIT_01719, partial [Catenibacterium mitsuokai DSM 15897]